jgi:carbohydrate diacid regulator
LEITRQYAQNIVEMTMRVLHYNINIMDHMGVIVGSGDLKRINSFHQGAAEVIKTGKAMEITVDQTGQLTGVKPGVNLPICFNDKIVGVVGITGVPGEVRPFGELLRISVETMLQQVFLTEQLQMEQNAKELYIRDIISGNYSEDEDIFCTKGSLLGFDMNLPRVAVVIKIYGLNEKIMGGIGKENVNDVENHRMSLKIQQRRENIFTHIKAIFGNPQDMISYGDGSSNFIIFYATSKTLPEESKAEISALLENLQTKLAKCNISCLTGIGLLHPGITGLKKSYDEAVQAIDIGERIKNSGDHRDNIFSASDLGLEILLLNQSAGVLRSYSDSFLQKNNKRVTLVNQAKLVETLNGFFAYNLNQSITAQKLNIARNTLTGRLDQVKDLTGYDPRNFNDAVKLKLFLLIDELQK